MLNTSNFHFLRPVSRQGSSLIFVAFTNDISTFFSYTN